jgi:phosphoglycolate phosphatase-like HAD superfamily hydrolase
MWQRHEIEPDFVSHKHRLEALRSFACSRFIHIGDTLTDLQFAAAAGFLFWYAADLPLSDPEAAILGGVVGLGPDLRTGPLAP